MTPRLFSIQTGLPRWYSSDRRGDRADEHWESAIVKQAVGGLVAIGRTGLFGDRQADLRYHGGPDKAACVYTSGHWPYWSERFPEIPWQPGSFGENFTVLDLDEDSVCLGDIWQIGNVRLQISQPRQPCWKLSRRWQLPALAAEVQRSGRTGWYLRVLSEGEVTAGMAIEIVDRGATDWPIARCNRVMFSKPYDVPALRELSEQPYLSDSWREDARQRICSRT